MCNSDDDNTPKSCPLQFLEDKKESTDLTISSPAVWDELCKKPQLWGEFKHLKKLDLNNLGLTTLPDALEVLAPTLEILFMSENKIEVFPPVIGKLTKLRMLSLRGNCIKELSSTNLPTSSLIWLILTNNQISHVHSNVGELKHVRKLMLSHNNIKSIPKEMGEMNS